MARLTPEQWEDVKAMYATGHYVVTDIAQQFGVSHTAINKRAKQENWQKLDYAIVTNAINASAELKREVSKVSKALQGKSHLCISFLGIAWPQSQFPHSCVCERFIYSQDRSTYFPAAGRPIPEIYKSLTDI